METRWHDVLVGDLMVKFSKIPFFLIKSKKKREEEKTFEKIIQEGLPNSVYLHNWIEAWQAKHT